MRVAISCARRHGSDGGQQHGSEKAGLNMSKPAGENWVEPAHDTQRRRNCGSNATPQRSTGLLRFGNRHWTLSVGTARDHGHGTAVLRPAFFGVTQAAPGVPCHRQWRKCGCRSHPAGSGKLRVLVARRADSEMLYSRVPRSSAWPSTCTVTLGYCYSHWACGQGFATFWRQASWSTRK